MPICLPQLSDLLTCLLCLALHLFQLGSIHFPKTHLLFPLDRSHPHNFCNIRTWLRVVDILLRWFHSFPQFKLVLFQLHFHLLEFNHRLWASPGHQCLCSRNLSLLFHQGQYLSILQLLKDLVICRRYLQEWFLPKGFILWFQNQALCPPRYVQIYQQSFQFHL